MDFLNLAKQGYEAYKESSDVSTTGGTQYNSPHHQQGGHPGGHHSPDLDHDEIVRSAQEGGSEDSSLFSSALGFLHQNKQKHTEPVDEEEVQRAHNAAYEEDSAGSMSADSMGSAAAMQALKMFTSGGGGGGGGGKNQLVSMAMSEASKLFDKSGGGGSGSKQDAVNSAGMTVMKMMVQSQFSNMIGGKDSGGMSGMLGMASKFL